MISSRGASLQKFNSFGIDTQCRQLWLVEKENDVYDLPPVRRGKFPLLLGDGTNVLLLAKVDQDVVLVHHQGRKVVHRARGRIYLAAGEIWDECVQWSIEEGLPGLENLAGIPGRVGAAPVQNIGAYGVELSHCLLCVRVFDMQDMRILDIPAKNCQLGYRHSLFKTRAAEHFLILGITLDLDRNWRPNLSYAGVKERLLQAGRNPGDAKDIMHTVRELRQEKLPDHKKTPNVGSFFKNPVVSEELATELQKAYPEMPAWPQVNAGVKLSAAWLLDQCGWKGQRRGDAGVSEKHSLVIVNYGQATGAELWKLAEDMRAGVYDKFAIKLVPEPRIIR